MLTLFVSFYSFFDRLYEMPESHSWGYRKLAILSTPLFGRHSYVALFFIIPVLLIFYIELMVFNLNETKEN